MIDVCACSLKCTFHMLIYCSIYGAQVTHFSWSHDGRMAVIAYQVIKINSFILIFQIVHQPTTDNIQLYTT